MRVAFVLVLLTSTASATPLTFGVGLGVGGMTTMAEDDSPSARTGGVHLSFGTPRFALELGAAYMRDHLVLDPFDDPTHDISVTWFEAAAVYHADLGAHLWVEPRVAVGRYNEDDHASTNPYGAYRRTSFGGGLRLGYDLRTTDRDTLGLYLDGELFGPGDVVPFGAASAMIGIEYRFTLR